MPSSRDHHTCLPPIAPLKSAFLTLLPLFPYRGHLLRWPFFDVDRTAALPALPHERHSPARYKTAATNRNPGFYWPLRSRSFAPNVVLLVHPTSAGGAASISPGPRPGSARANAAKPRGAAHTTPSIIIFLTGSSYSGNIRNRKYCERSPRGSLCRVLYFLPNPCRMITIQIASFLSSLF